MAFKETDLVNKAKILIESLPYIQQFSGKTVVIKYGGAAMTNDSLKHSVMKDIVLMKYIGIQPVVVHGGGPKISQMMKRMGKESKFVQGLRVTDHETVEIAEMVLAGSINKEIVQLINQHGGNAPQIIVIQCLEHDDLVEPIHEFRIEGPANLTQHHVGNISPDLLLS